MIKRVLKYLLIVIIVFISFYFIHEYVLSSKQLNLSYSLLNVYLFNAIASILVFSAIEIIANKLPDQAGHAFLACIFLKIGFFLVLFQEIIFPELKLELFQRLSLIIPFFLYIILESVSISKLLNSKT